MRDRGGSIRIVDNAVVDPGDGDGLASGCEGASARELAGCERKLGRLYRRDLGVVGGDRDGHVAGGSAGQRDPVSVGAGSAGGLGDGNVGMR